MSRATVLLTVSVLATACASPIPVQPDDYTHMLTIDADGDMVPVQVAGEVTARGADDGERHIQEIVAALAASKKRRVMLIIHGGLITNEAAVEEAVRGLRAMEGEDFFPIFVNWETGMGTSYADHLFAIRGGEKSRAEALFTWPLYLVADFGRAITRYPETLRVQGYEAVKELVLTPPLADAPPGWGDTVRLDRRNDAITFPERLDTFRVGIVPGTARLATTPILDGIGRSAFLNMQRRARVLFLRDEDHSATSVRQPTGALSRLMNALRPLNTQYRDPYVREIEQEIVEVQAELALNRTLHTHSTKYPEDGCEHCTTRTEKLEQLAGAADAFRGGGALQVTIVAHSMGTIVANELIRSNADFYYDDIVYMGAACTVGEFARSALPYVKDHAFTRFHNLCLHPVEEANDRYAIGFLPFGSLLDWIDNYITDRKSALDGTLGKWANITKVLTVVDYLTSDVRARIFVKGFGRNPGDPDDPLDVGDPRDHGDFNDVDRRFWGPTFWALPPAE